MHLSTSSKQHPRRLQLQKHHQVFLANFHWQNKNKNKTKNKSSLHLLPTFYIKVYECEYNSHLFSHALAYPYVVCFVFFSFFKSCPYELKLSIQVCLWNEIVTKRWNLLICFALDFIVWELWTYWCVVRTFFCFVFDVCYYLNTTGCLICLYVYFIFLFIWF